MNEPAVTETEITEIDYEEAKAHARKMREAWAEFEAEFPATAEVGGITIHVF